MYWTTDPTVAGRLAKLYVDDRVHDAEARRVARAIRRETRVTNMTPPRPPLADRTRTMRTPDPPAAPDPAENDRQFHNGHEPGPGAGPVNLPFSREANQ